MNHNLYVLTIVLAFASSISAAYAKTYTRPEILDTTKVDACGGTVLRIPGFDFREEGLQFASDGRPVMNRDESTAAADGFACYRLHMTDRRFPVYDDWSFGSLHTVPLKANRSYIVSILLDADFERPAEINAGFKTLDASGKQVIWNLNGLPNKTDGWRRWQWEFTADPRATHGVFSMLLVKVPLDGTKLRIADIAIVELPPKALPDYQPGEGATFRGGPGALPMKVESAQSDETRLTVETTGARYTFDVESEHDPCRAAHRKPAPCDGLEIVARSRRT